MEVIDRQLYAQISWKLSSDGYQDLSDAVIVKLRLTNEEIKACVDTEFWVQYREEEIAISQWLIGLIQTPDEQDAFPGETPPIPPTGNQPQPISEQTPPPPPLPPGIQSQPNPEQIPPPPPPPPGIQPQHIPQQISPPPPPPPPGIQPQRNSQQIPPPETQTQPVLDPIPPPPVLHGPFLSDPLPPPPAQIGLPGANSPPPNEGPVDWMSRNVPRRPRTYRRRPKFRSIKEIYNALN